MTAIATVNYHGPDGEFVEAGQPLPEGLAQEHVDSLIETGGAILSPDDASQLELPEDGDES